MNKFKKRDIQDKLPVSTYLLSIISYSINARHPMSEYFPIREYSYIVQSCYETAWHLYKYVTNVFNVRASVSIGTKLYTCAIRKYDVEYLSRACLLAYCVLQACVGISLTDLVQHNPWLSWSPVSLADFWASYFSFSGFIFRSTINSIPDTL